MPSLKSCTRVGRLGVGCLVTVDVASITSADGALLAFGVAVGVLLVAYELKDLFKEWLTAHYPLKAEHVMSIIRQSRDGQEYQSGFGTRMRGTGKYADLIAQRFALATKRLKLGFGRRMGVDTTRFRVPAADGQLSLWSE